MLREFLELIQNTAVDAATPKVMDVGDPRSQMVFKMGPLVDIPAPLRDHKIFGIADFIKAVQKWGDPTDGPPTAAGVVFHSHSRLKLVVDDLDRRDFVTMALTESETFKFLKGLGRKRHTHAEFVDVLKNQLRDRVTDALLPMVRKLDVSTGSRASSDIQQGREKGTREFMQELANADQLPEVVDVKCSVYSNAGLRTTRIIRCSLDVILPALEFTLRPLPDEMDIAVEDAQADIHAILTLELEPSEGVTILFGEFV